MPHLANFDLSSCILTELHIHKNAAFGISIGVREIFSRGGGVNHLPKSTSQVAQIFTLAYEGGSIQFFRVNTKSEHKLGGHKQTFGKIATTVVLR